jgi:2-phospho-L-lactate guanylyltransferase
VIAVAAATQGTVCDFDPRTRTGAVLLDDGSRLEFSAAAFAASGLRLLRVGQRLRLERDRAGQVIRVTLVTMS